MKVRELADKLGAALSGPGEGDLRGAAGITEATGNDVTFLADAKHARDLAACRAGAVIVPLGAAAPSTTVPTLAVKNPRYAFAQAVRLLYGRPYAAGGVSDRAAIADGVTLGKDVTIHPCAVIAPGARIGDRVTLYPGVYIGEGSVVGDDSVLYSSVSVREGVAIGSRVIIHAGAVIGSDGFGFVTEGGVHHKIPQVGGVIIGDDVEIGANCTIDRGALGNTIIGKGTKLDNMVHIAHNVTIGEYCLLAAQVGIAGSSSLGSYVVIGGQTGVGDHLVVGDKVMIGGGTAVTRDVEPEQVIAGHNAMPVRDWLKVQAVLPKLPDLKKLLAELERRVGELEPGKKSH